MYQFVVGQDGLNKTAATNIPENLQTLDFFPLYFETILPVILQEPTAICSKMPKQEKNQTPPIPSK